MAVEAAQPEFQPTRSQLEFTLDALKATAANRGKGLRPLQRLALRRQLNRVDLNDEVVVAAAEDLHNNGMLPPDGARPFFSPDFLDRLFTLVEKWLPLLLRLFGIT